MRVLVCACGVGCCPSVADGGRIFLRRGALTVGKGGPE